MARPFTILKPDDSVIVRWIKLGLESLMGLEKLDQYLSQMERSTPHAFISDCVTRPNWKITTEDKEKLKAHAGSGPVIVVVNHPHGIPDALVVLKTLLDETGREDIRLIASRVATQIFGVLDRYLIPVNNMKTGTPEAALENAAALGRSLRLLSDKGVLIVFPAGSVAEFKFKSREGVFAIADPDWQLSFAELAVRTGTPILPIYITGRNSLFFQVISFFGQTAKRLLLFREYMNCRNEHFRLEVGTLIDPKNFGGDRRKLADFVRQEVFSLKEMR